MKKGYALRSNIGILGGILINILILASVFTNPSLIFSVYGTLLSLLSVALFLYGCCMYIGGKGYHMAWGILGLFNLLGLLVLALFPDKCREGKKPQSFLVRIITLLFVAIGIIFLFVVVIIGGVAFLASDPDRLNSFKELGSSLENKVQQIYEELGKQIISQDVSYEQKLEILALLTKERDKAAPSIRKAVAALEKRQDLSKEDQVILHSLKSLVAIETYQAENLPSQHEHSVEDVPE